MDNEHFTRKDIAECLDFMEANANGKPLAIFGVTLEVVRLARESLKREESKTQGSVSAWSSDKICTITVSGPTGCGKTYIANHIAHDLISAGFAVKHDDGMRTPGNRPGVARIDIIEQQTREESATAPAPTVESVAAAIGGNAFEVAAFNEWSEGAPLSDESRAYALAGWLARSQMRTSRDDLRNCKYITIPKRIVDELTQQAVHGEYWLPGRAHALYELGQLIGVDVSQAVRRAADPIVERVVNRIRERAALGLDKYTTNLKDSQEGERAFLVHLQDELLDGANYCQKRLDDFLPDSDDAPEFDNTNAND